MTSDKRGFIYRSVANFIQLWIIERIDSFHKNRECVCIKNSAYTQLGLGLLDSKLDDSRFNGPYQLRLYQTHEKYTNLLVKESLSTLTYENVYATIQALSLIMFEVCWRTLGLNFEIKWRSVSLKFCKPKKIKRDFKKSVKSVGLIFGVHLSMNRHNKWARSPKLLKMIFFFRYPHFYNEFNTSKAQKKFGVSFQTTPRWKIF